MKKIHINSITELNALQIYLMSKICHLTTMTTGWDGNGEFYMTQKVNSFYFSSPLTLIVLEALDEHSFKVLCSGYI